MPQKLTDSDLPYEFQYPQCYTAPGDPEERAARFRKWCDENGVYCYSRPRESFFQFEAYELAAKAGCAKVIMEDLS